MKKYIKIILKKIIGLPAQSYIEILKHRGLKVGSNFKMLEECIIDDSHCWHIEIGDDVTLAPRVHILAHDASTKTHLEYTKIKNVFIGNRVFVGAGSIILPGTIIGDDVIIGAGSIVKGDVQANAVYGGNPAKYICKITAYLDKMKNLMTESNTFGEEFTLRQNVDSKKKQQMKDVVNQKKIGFVY